MTTLKGYFKKPEEKKPNLIGEVASVVTLVNDLNNVKEEIIGKIEDKIQETESVIRETKQTTDENIKRVDESIQKVESTVQDAKETLNQTKKEVLDYVKEKAIQGEPGKNADPVDTESIIKQVVALIPKPEIPTLDENSLLKKFLKAVPKNKASLKIIQESFETDPMSVIEKIMSLPEGKFKLKSSQIDGLEQTISAFRNQLSRGYLHGGGISNITGLIEAGTNITITGDGTKTSPYIINSSGGSGTPGGAVNSIQFNDSGTFNGFGTWDGSLFSVPGGIDVTNASTFHDTLSVESTLYVNDINAPTGDLNISANNAVIINASGSGSFSAGQDLSLIATENASLSGGSTASISNGSSSLSFTAGDGIIIQGDSFYSLGFFAQGENRSNLVNPARGWSDVLSGFVAGSPATGSLSFTDNPTAGEAAEITDGDGNVFNFVADTDFVIDTDYFVTATNLGNAIGSQLNINVVDDGMGNLTLTDATNGILGNVDINSNLSNVTPTGMSGGVEDLYTSDMYMDDSSGFLGLNTFAYGIAPQYRLDVRGSLNETNIFGVTGNYNFGGSTFFIDNVGGDNADTALDFKHNGSVTFNMAWVQSGGLPYYALINNQFTPLAINTSGSPVLIGSTDFTTYVDTFTVVGSSHFVGAVTADCTGANFTVNALGGDINLNGVSGAVNVNAPLNVNGNINNSSMPTGDPMDGLGTLWYDTMTNQVFRGT